MTNFIKNFRRDESGAVTVDWVVLTAAVVGLAAVMVVTILGGAESLGEGTGDYLSAAQVGD